MISVAVTGYEEDLVYGLASLDFILVIQEMQETLPLGFLPLGIEVGISLVWLINQIEISLQGAKCPVVSTEQPRAQSTLERPGGQ